MIKGRLIKNQGYGFITVIFLVLALSCLSILAFLNQRDTDKLAKAVGDLSDTRTSIDRVDDAIRLLYAAENNCRLFILQKDSAFAKAYEYQLLQVSGILDSISHGATTGDNSLHMNLLVNEKSLKTKAYIEARLLLDSLLQLASAQTEETLNLQTTVSTFNVHKPIDVKVDSQLQTVELPEPKKKRFFRRLSDAIVNKQYKERKKEAQQLIIRQRSLDSVYLVKSQDLASKNSALQEQAQMYRSLKQREQELLNANHKLLQGLQTILRGLKLNILAKENERKALLSKNAFSIANDIKFGNTLLIFFGLLLTLIIILILQRLFKNSKQLNQAKEKAEEYARLKSEFAETMSHEIRTPLHSITRFANELSTESKKDDQAEVIDAIKLSSGMLLSVVNNILDYTKMEKGKFKLAQNPFNPMRVVLEILSGLQLQAKRKNLVLEKHLETQIDTTLIGDAFQLRQLLINLLSNAIKYTNENGSIRINVSLVRKGTDNCILVMSIKDTGIGMDAKIETQSGHSLFEAYVTAVHHREIKEGSTGLGLSIVKRVVELHRGKINVESVMGKGTTFNIELPYKFAPKNLKVVDEEALVEAALHNSSTNQPASVPQRKTASEAANSKNMKVLVVDNDYLNRAYIVMVLKRKGYKVTESESAIKALELAKAEYFDLVITDLMMPELDGNQLADRLHAGESLNKNIAVLCVSGQDLKMGAGGDKAKQKFDGFLQKPFEPKALYDKINELKKQLKPSINTP